jgi:hypothetical protein
MDETETTTTTPPQMGIREEKSPALILPKESSNSEEKTVKFNETAKPPYHGKIKAPTRIVDTGDVWYIMVNNGVHDGPYSNAEMRGFYEANMFADDTMCTNEGIDGKYYKLSLLFYPSIRDAFLPDECNPLIDLEHRTVAASADITRVAEKLAWNQAAGEIVTQLTNTDTDPVEGDDELIWFIHHGNPKWLNKNGETIIFGESIRRDFIQVGEIMTMFEARKLDPRTYHHKGDGILRIKINVNGIQEMVCVKEMLIFKINDVLYKLYPVVNGLKRYFVAQTAPDVVEVVFFTDLTPQPEPETEVKVSEERITKCKTIPDYEEISCMERYSVSDLLAFNEDRVGDIRIFAKNTENKRPLLKLIEDRSSINTILTHGKHWVFKNWEDSKEMCILFTVLPILKYPMLSVCQNGVYRRTILN